MYLNFTINAGANALKMFRNIKEQSNISIIKLPDPNYTKRARVKMPWPDEEKENTQNLIDLTVTNLYPNVAAVKNSQTEAKIRRLANADSYGNLKAKSYLRLALQEPIIPETVFEVIENSKSKNFFDLAEDFENEFSIFPNPSSNGLFNLTFPFEASKIEINVFNNLGQNVHAETLHFYLSVVNLKHLKPGVYYFKINYQLGNHLATEHTKVLITND